MNKCDTKLNFFESKDPIVINSLLKIDINNENLGETRINMDTTISDEYLWVEGRSNIFGVKKAHGGFIKHIGNGTGLKSYILHKKP